MTAANNNLESAETSARVLGLLPEWKDAYAAFKGAFDNPIARRKIFNDYMEDARQRLYKFNDLMIEAAKSQDITHFRLSTEWANAFMAYAGAVDTPDMRLMYNDEYATDARNRLREFSRAFALAMSTAA